MPTPRDTGQSIHLLLLGAIVGMIGGILMALFTMLATATYLQMGFFTPLYAIAAPVLATWDIRSENRHVAHDGTRLLAEACVMRVHSTTSILLVRSG
jgi:membrane protein implicated in regulation of membrane protease activity